MSWLKGGGTPHMGGAPLDGNPSPSVQTANPNMSLNSNQHQVKIGVTHIVCVIIYILCE